jgi:hypothetical protein
MTIPTDDRVNRQIFYPHMYEARFREALDPICTFLFTKDCKTGDRVECLVWSRHAADNKIHSMGFEHEQEKIAKGKDCRYDGFIWSVAGRINDIDFEGFGFYLKHDPTEGMHHLEPVPSADLIAREWKIFSPGLTRVDDWRR